MASSKASRDAAPSASNGVSKTTISIAGLALDIFGLSELIPVQTNVSCLWLHHGRTRRKEDMAEVAERMVSSFNQQLGRGGNSNNGDTESHRRGLIVVTFDQRNHGTRQTDKLANSTWRSGNTRHAQDMFATVTGTVVDTMHLMDVLEGYLWLEDTAAPEAGAAATANARKTIDQHLVLGVSLGGHCAWQLLFEDPRITAGVVVIGCPDYMRLMTNRAKGSKLPTFQSHDGGASFLGSKDFPPALVAAAKRWDPKARLFGTDAIPPAGARPEEVHSLLDRTIRGKRIQILSGGKDKLVPYAVAKPFLDFFKDAVGAWYKHDEVYVEDNVYPEAGHEFSEEMKEDAVRFVLDSVGKADGATGQQQEKQQIALPKM
ncbi:uncharacterized protein B0I36DRAFT_365441 [Microdochium trichocladiopsis]|uniref:Alpha/Beta hydrolase protein n=1 Tax=Microdochium trichocladiopsis TaxID=1682393 RepID=A0A9P8XZK0_9PEZI|nr:uncharacterized protein B0I36DRAFT_365441 [Microdochium trichocladiopsis]KAH7025775.1 hypothetical protein B0I36DRAFT_365441 [Microdochium trichocladiopsis]